MRWIIGFERLAIGHQEIAITQTKNKRKRGRIAVAIFIGRNATNIESMSPPNANLVYLPFSCATIMRAQIGHDTGWCVSLCSLDVGISLHRPTTSRTGRAIGNKILARQTPPLADTTFFQTSNTDAYISCDRHFSVSTITLFSLRDAWDSPTCKAASMN